MPVLRVRLTVRRLMVAVAAFAIGFGCVAAWRERAAHLGRARRAAVMAEVNRAIVGSVAPRPGASPDEASREMEASRSIARQRADHYARLAEKYRLAARRPWLPVAPDPPEPE